MDTTPQLIRAPSGTQWRIGSGGHEAAIVEVGGGLRTYRAGDNEIVDGYAEDELCPGSAGQILAPWPNRIRDGRFAFARQSHQLALSEPTRHNAIHGLVCWARWEAVEVTGSSVTVQHDLVPQPGYPWPLRLRTVWSVTSGGLRADHEVTNIGAEACPFGLAPHPYLQVPRVSVDELLLHVPARSRLLVDGRMLPIGAARVTAGEYDFTEPRRIGAAILDTAFGDVERDADGGSAVTVRGPGGPGVQVWADSAFGWWQVYTGDTLERERVRRSVAIEPMTCPPDAFRSGRDVIVLEPGEVWRGSWGIRPVG